MAPEPHAPDDGFVDVELADVDIAQVLVDFTRTLADGQSVSDVFTTLAEYTTTLLGVDGVGILLLQEGSLVVATASSPIGDAVEQLEAELAEGPCTDSIRTGRHVIVPDLREAIDHYPNFAPRAIAVGAVGIFGLPMGGSDHLIGALDIMTSRPKRIGERALRIADMLADVAVSYLVTTRAHEQANALASQLQLALDSRIVIEQAKGILAGRHSIALDEAFERMRHRARNNGVRIHEIAGAVCDGTLDLPDG